MEKTIILYHGNCPDGFGGAYAAWKKFGNTAEYISLSRNDAPPIEAVRGATAIFIDFCYTKDVMDAFNASAARVVMLDHHEGMKDVIESIPEYRYAEDHSGAVIAWQYFHPDTPVPMLLSYIEDGDLYRFALPDAHAFLSYIYTKPFTFESWSALETELASEEGRTRAKETGQCYSEHNEILMQQIADSADLVSFEGYTIYLASTSRQFGSYVGNTLAKKQGPLALIATVRPDGIRVSLRGDGSVDVAKIAQKYGGNGHPNAAAFSLSWGASIPWTPVLDENPSH